MNGLIGILMIILLSLVGAVGDYFLKIAGNGEKYIDFRFFIVGFLLFSSTAIGWFYVFKHIKLSTVGIMYGISTTLILVAIGIIFFNERLNTYEIIGIISGIFSMILLTRFT